MEPAEPQPCRFFKAGKCKKGEACRFSHENPHEALNPAAVCHFFQRGICRNGQTCAFLHTARVEAVLGPAPESWSVEQQKQLDVALETFPSDMEKQERWTNIATHVLGKSKAACFARFKHLCELVRSATAVPTVFLSPVENCTQLDCADLSMYAIDTFHLTRLQLQMACEHCPLLWDVSLASTDVCRQWCPRCSTLHSVQMHPVLVHAANSVAASVQVSNCSVQQVLPSSILGVCSKCQHEKEFPAFQSGRRNEANCFHCHSKMAIEFKSMAFPLPSSSGASAPVRMAKKQQIVPKGQPLPYRGKCIHYTKSHRWFRFQCCAKCFPCDICHEQSPCEQSGMLASKWICGDCSNEYPSSVKVCAHCGNQVGAVKKSSHWEGGAGCRDSKFMAAGDKQKHRGKGKTLNKKASRVGLAGKLKREKKAAAAAQDG